MPYIKDYDREQYKAALRKIKSIHSKGELEYLIYSLMGKYMSDKQFNYTNLHDCTYAAQHCCDEFRRRFLDKREDEAMKENGDIF